MTRRLALAAAAIALVAGGAYAQSRPKPDLPRAPTAPLSYASPFAGYRTFDDVPLASWREVNDEVGRIGGHVGVLRAEQGGDAQPATVTAPAAAPAPVLPRDMHADTHTK
ncbi:MAG: hypothetical protein M5U08_21640 [Burkholderiales bacterium]|nr:hypothetical protein [Burkholderiales bacterium]